MKRFVILLSVIVLLAMLTGCAPGPNTLADTPDQEGDVAGFWLGLWHGIIAPVTFIISLFTRNVQMYEVHNNGNWYNSGFVIGAVVLIGGSHGARSSR